MAHTVHLERKTLSLGSAVETLRLALVDAERPDVTAADAATLTGLPLAHCEQALLELCSRYPSRLRVTDGGGLRVTFHSLTQPLQRRRPSPLSRALARVRRLGEVFFTSLVVPPLLLVASVNHAALLDWARQHGWWMTVPVGVVVFPVGTLVFALGFLGAVLLSFFPVLGALLGVMGVAIPFITFFDKGTGSLPWWGQLLLFAFLAAVCVPTLLWPARMLLKNAVEMYAELLSEQGVQDVRGLWAQVGGFLLGPPPPDPLEDERRLVALVRARQGVVADVDLMELFGWSRWDAAAECARVLADYGGDLLTGEDGTVHYDFSRLRAARQDVKDMDIRPAWERGTPSPPFFGCPVPTAVITLLAAALALAGLALHPALAWLPSAAVYAGPSGLLEGLGVWPYLLLALPALRLPAWLWRRQQASRNPHFLRLLQDALAHPEGVTLAQHADLPVAVSLGGQVADPGPEGQTRVEFPDVLKERAATAAARARTRPVPPPKVVLDVDDADLEPPPRRKRGRRK